MQSEKTKRKFLEIQRRQKEFHFLLQQDHTQPLVVGEPAMLAPLKNLTNQVSLTQYIIVISYMNFNGIIGTAAQARVTRCS